MKLRDKVAIVTGAGVGIGRAVARALCGEAAKVALWDINRDTVAAAAAELDRSGASAVAMPVDVTDAEQVRATARAVAERWGRIDILVNNAGGGGSAAGLHVGDAQWDDIVALNLKSQFLCCRSVAPYMENQGHGRIINMASNAGRYRSNTGLGGIPYAAAKAGVLQMTRHAAYLLGRRRSPRSRSFLPRTIRATSRGPPFWPAGDGAALNFAPIRRA